MGSYFSSSSDPVDMEGELAKEVQSIIDSNTVVIFSKSYCPYCTMAKKVFESIQQTYTCIELNERNDGSAIQAILAEITGASTVPRVFVKGRFIGGGSDVKEMHSAGNLVPLLS